ncbi:MAG: ribonuclease P protein component [Acidobacteriia bacterium]|nr:ribonuclease P protein component [Terriglobia bacterium]
MTVTENEECFPKRIRLLRRSEFQRVYKNGRRARADHFTVFFDHNQLPYSRFGITVSRKLGSAVTRNRLRRIFREAIRKSRTSAVNGLDFVFNPHAEAVKIQSTELLKELAAVYFRLKEKNHAARPADHH